MGSRNLICWRRVWYQDYNVNALDTPVMRVTGDYLNSASLEIESDLMNFIKITTRDNKMKCRKLKLIERNNLEKCHFMSNPVCYLIHLVSHGKGEVVLSYFTLQSRSFHLDRGCIPGGKPECPENISRWTDLPAKKGKH